MARVGSGQDSGPRTSESSLKGTKKFSHSCACYALKYGIIYACGMPAQDKNKGSKMNFSAATQIAPDSS